MALVTPVATVNNPSDKQVSREERSDCIKPKKDNKLELKTAKNVQQSDEFSREIEAQKHKVREALTTLQESDDFGTHESYKAFEAITIASLDESNRQVLGDYLAEMGYAELYVRAMLWLKTLKSLSHDEQEELKFIAEMMGGYWNFSDGSPLLCRRFGECGVIGILFEDLQNAEVAIAAVKMLKKEKKRHHLFAKLGILHNCIRLCGANRAVYRKAKAVPILSNFLETAHVAVYVKTICLLILAYIVDETESESLASSSTGGCVNFLITLLRKALNSDNQRYGGFSACELLEGINHLSLNDTNKIKTVEGGCLPLMTRMMHQGQSEEAQLLATRGVWRLAFVPSNKNVIKKDETLLNALQQLQKSHNQSLRKVCTGALWEIYDGEINSEINKPSVGLTEKSAVDRKKVETDVPHVMISYQWDVQSQMIILKDLLTSHGYSVWMDIEKMEGNILVAMANAVEKAAVVLVCVSQKYKDSESCRTEASYAYKKKKPIIPLMVENGYDPDGWLGALIGVRLYFTMHNNNEVQTQLPNLKQELGTRGLRQTSETGISDQPDGRIIPSTMITTTTVPSTSSQSSESTNDILAKWTPEQFQTWLHDIGTQEDVRQQLNYCNGMHLIQMYRQCKCCPVYFHSALRSDLKMDFHAVLKFTTSLEELFLDH